MTTRYAVVTKALSIFGARPGSHTLQLLLPYVLRAVSFHLARAILRWMEVRMQSERRRAIFEAVVEKYEKHGDKFEDDPGFRASVEEWIAGTIEIDELRARYRVLSELRRNTKTLARSNIKASKL